MYDSERVQATASKASTEGSIGEEDGEVREVKNRLTSVDIKGRWEGETRERLKRA